MPKRRFNKLDPEVRGRILQAAALEFGTHGFADASLNRIVEQAGISKGSMYYYFEDKEDLFDMVLEDLEARSIEMMKYPMEDLTADTYWPCVEAAQRGWLQIAIANPWIQGFLQLFSEMLRNPPTEGPLVVWHSKMVQRRTDFIRRGQELGVVRDDLPLEFLSEILNGLQLAEGCYFSKRFGAMANLEREEMSAIMFDIARRILLPASKLAELSAKSGTAKRKAAPKGS